MKRALVSLLLLLCGCHKEEPAVPTAAQSAQLNDAENMLNAAANEEGPEQSPGPSNSSD